MNIQTTTMQRKPQSESEIKTKIKEYLESLGWIVIFLVISNRDGFPDVIALQKNGRTLFIETKAPGKKPNQLQSFRHEQLRKKGFDVLVADNVDTVKIYCNNISNQISESRDEFFVIV